MIVKFEMRSMSHILNFECEVGLHSALNMLTRSGGSRGVSMGSLEPLFVSVLNIL